MRIETEQVPLVLTALAIALAPHAFTLPPWILVFCFTCWGYVYYLDRNKLKWPGKLFRAIAMSAGIIGIFITYGAALDSEAFLGLLVLLAGLKSLELESFRHRMVALFLAYFLVLARVLNTESLASALYMAASVACTTAVMIHLNRKNTRLSSDMMLAAKILLQAFPVAIVLFFLFPRFQGNIWGISRSAVGVSGFSDHISPGDIISLARSPAVAFRVQFADPVPDSSNLYWRGLVLWRFDGKSWHQGAGIPVESFPASDQNPIRYALTLEPHENRWLFALDVPVSAPNAAYMTADRTLYLKRIAYKRQMFDLVSAPFHAAQRLRPWEQQALQLPDSGNPRSTSLARTWAKQFFTENQIIEKALEFFEKEDFVYTLSPPGLSGDPLDDFLFNTKAGFCEHYASAFAFLMRAAGIPARVVVGYLGGQKNPFGDYLIVRQSDAHAWTEVWTAEQGWRRIDPTAAVAPERIEQETGAGILADRTLRRTIRYPGFIARFLEPVALAWDAAANQWNLRVIGYTQQRQFSLLEKTGLPKTRAHTVLILLLAIGIILLLAAAIIRSKGVSTRRRADPVQQSYEKFCDKLARCGLPRRPDQGPSDYAQHVGSIRKDLKESVDRIIHLYIRLRYGPEYQIENIRIFHKTVRKFNPGSSTNIL